MKKIVVLTGAGVSAESGLKTFRDNNGLWENHRVEDVATPEAFEANPELVYRFYNLRRAQLISGDVVPNKAHEALARLESIYQDNFLLVTQNVDDLHERAGSNRVLHMHGELLSAKCPETGIRKEWRGELNDANLCHCCTPANGLRPDIVWFGEMPYHMETIYNALKNADLFIAIGTSGHVYPAAGFVQEASFFGAETVELNLEPSEVCSAFSQQVYGPASEVVPKFIDSLISK